MTIRRFTIPMQSPMPVLPAPEYPHDDRSAQPPCWCDVCRQRPAVTCDRGRPAMLCHGCARRHRNANVEL